MRRGAAAPERPARHPDPAEAHHRARADDGRVWLAVADVPDDGWPAPAGPLGGWTFGVKDNVDVAGLPTTAAFAPLRYVPERSATVVRRLVEAGASCIGKTNLDQLATGLVGTRSPHGTPTNPLDARLVPGGSSSGSAVAVARGDVRVAVATDTAGSGRVPAALCGLVGWKPAPGGWPRDGLVPACRTLDTISAFTTCVADAVAVDAAVRAADPVAAAPYVARVGLADATSLDACDAPTAAGFAATVARLGRARDRVGTVVAFDTGVLAEVGALLYEGPWVAERTAAVGDLLDAHPDAAVAEVAHIIGGGRAWSAVDAFRARYRLDDLAEVAAERFADVDVLVAPTVPFLPTLAEVAADPLGTNHRLGRFTHAANLLGLASITVPGAPRPDGLAASVTVLAPPDRWPALVTTALVLADEAHDHGPEGARAAGSIERRG